MQNKILCAMTTALLFLSTKAIAASDKDYQVQFVNNLNKNVQVIAAPVIGEINDNEPIAVNAHNTSAVYDVNTDGFSGGVIQAAWILNNQQINCPPAVLPNKLNGELYTFALNKNAMQNYSCTESGMQKS